MPKTKEMIEDLYSRLGILAVVAVLGFIFVILGIIALLFITGFTLGDTEVLTNTGSANQCDDYDPCSKDVCEDNMCFRGIEHPNGHDCSKWACLKPEAEATCQYNPFTMKSECVSEDCAGSCFFSNNECPEIVFNDGVDNSIECDSRVCIYTARLGAEHIWFEASCHHDHPLYIKACMNLLNTSAQNEHIDSKCLRVIPECDPFEDVGGEPDDDDAERILTKCHFFFACSCVGENPQVKKSVPLEQENAQISSGKEQVSNVIPARVLSYRNDRHHTE